MRLPSATGTKLRVLATGDSLMIRVARHFAKQLRGQRALVQQDIHFGAGISHNFVYDWRPGSREEAISAHPPDVVVLFLGGSEGTPFGSIQCCGQAWIDEYAKRARQIIHNYRRGGAAQDHQHRLTVRGRPAVIRLADQVAARQPRRPGRRRSSRR